MIPINNNLCPLAFHNRLDGQSHRKSYAYGEIYPLYAPLKRLLPFQFIRPHRESLITSVNLYTKDGELVSDITQEMKDSGLRIVKFADYDVIVYPATFDLPSIENVGQYYITLSDGTQTWYSDVLTLVSDMSGYIKVEWWDDENLVMDSGQIVYEGIRYRNTLYLCTQIGKPDYEFEEEGESRDGLFFAEKQISKKVYRFVILASEPLCDAMRFIRMSDYVIVTDQYKRQYDCGTFTIDPKWEVQGNLASVECEFTTNTAVKKVGNGYLRIDKGDFNIDFNDDYLIK